MSRRDTIIVAVLINAALLALLFMLAVNTDDDKVLDPPEPSRLVIENQAPRPSPSTPVPLVKAQIEPQTADEVDSFLKGLAAENHPQPILFEDEGAVEIRQSQLADNAMHAPSAPLDGGNYVEITVKRGDVLEKIARNNGTTIEAIKKINNLSTTKLTVGQILRVPVAKPVKGEAVAVAQPLPSKPKEEEKKPSALVSDVQYYTIKNGDNPWKIAKQYNVKFEELLRLNNLDEEKARNLKIGDKIRVK